MSDDEDNQEYKHEYGSIKTPADLLAIPGYEHSVDFGPSSGRRLLEMLDHYDFAKKDEYPCGIKGCNTIHQHGYFVRTTDGKLTNIGQVCGKRHLNLDYKKARKTYLTKRKAADNRKSINEIRSQLAQYKARLDTIAVRSRSINSCRDILRELIPIQYSQVSEMGRKGQREIIGSRRMNTREAEIHYLRTGKSRKDYEGGRPLIEEVVGRLSGTDFFRGSLESLLKKQILPPLEYLQSLTDEQIQAMKPRDLEDISINTNNALRLIPNAERFIGHGLKFFEANNLKLLGLMGANPESISKVVLACEELLDFHEQVPG